MFLSSPHRKPPQATGTDLGDSSASLLGLRSAVVMLCAIVTAVTAGALTFWAAPSLPRALLVGGGCMAGAVVFFDRLIGR